MAAFVEKYPLRKMTDVGDWFFLPNITGTTLAMRKRYFTKRAKALGITLSVEDDVHGIKVTRVA